MAYSVRGRKTSKFPNLNDRICLTVSTPLRYCALQVEEERPSTRQRNDWCVPLLERYSDGNGVEGPHSRVQTSHKASSSTVYVRGLGSILADEEVHMAFLLAHRSSAINHAAPSPPHPHTPLSPFQRWNSTTFTFQAPSSIWIFVCSQSGDQLFFFQVQLVANVATQLKVNLAYLAFFFSFQLELPRQILILKSDYVSKLSFQMFADWL
jgi:hypothetical protein